MRSAPRTRRLVRPLVAVLGALVLGLATAPPAVAEPPSPTWLPPVDAPVASPFAGPPTPYAAGNRGIDFDTEPGQEVRASGAGEVTFAGQVGGALHVVVLHEGGLRTSYSFLATVAVARGDLVAAATVVGTAGEALHFGARIGEAYVDPAPLLAGAPPSVHLVPVVPDRLRVALAESDERGLLEDLLVDYVVATAAGADWARDRAEDVVEGAEVVGQELVQMAEDVVDDQVARLRIAAHYVTHGAGPLALLSVYGDWQRLRLYAATQDAGCTDPAAPPPPPPPGPRVVVLVGGFGSSSDSAGIASIDPTVLGDAEVLQFSYAGGAVPGGEVDGLAATEYAPADANGDLSAAGDRLRALLGDLAAERPGVPVDVVAHSQGGIVARLALDEPGADLPAVSNLVTLGAPHHGSDLATANRLLGTTDIGDLAQIGVADRTGGAVDGASPAAVQLEETSGLIRRLTDLPLPAGTGVTSIAADGDLVVSALHSALEGATNVLVPRRGPSAHADLPTDPDVEREIALALADAPPTCRDLTTGMLMAFAITRGEDAAGLLVNVGAHYVEAQIGGGRP